jgi:hypothetical protein
MAPLHASLSLSFSLSVRGSRGRGAHISARHISTSSRSTHNCFSHAWTARTSGMWDFFFFFNCCSHDCQHGVGLAESTRCRPDTGLQVVYGGVMRWAGFRSTTFVSLFLKIILYPSFCVDAEDSLTHIFILIPLQKPILLSLFAVQTTRRFAPCRPPLRFEV